MRPMDKKLLASLHQQEVWLQAAVLLEKIAGKELEKIWCRGTARRADGEFVDQFDKNACYWCADSLIDLNAPSGPVALAAGRALAVNLPFEPTHSRYKIRGDVEIWHWNDAEHRRPRQVRRAFRVAARRALQFAEMAA